MSVYNFKAQFAAAVERGEKTQTIRAPRKNGHAQVGDTVKLYTVLPTKKGADMSEWPVSLRVQNMPRLRSNPLLMSSVGAAK